MRANAPPAPQMSTGEWNPTHQMDQDSLQKGGITWAEALETTPGCFLHLVLVFIIRLFRGRG